MLFVKNILAGTRLSVLRAVFTSDNLTTISLPKTTGAVSNEHERTHKQVQLRQFHNMKSTSVRLTCTLLLNVSSSGAPTITFIHIMAVLLFLIGAVACPFLWNLVRLYICFSISLTFQPSLRFSLFTMDYKCSSLIRIFSVYFCLMMLFSFGAFFNFFETRFFFIFRSPKYTQHLFFLMLHLTSSKASFCQSYTPIAFKTSLFIQVQNLQCLQYSLSKAINFHCFKSFFSPKSPSPLFSVFDLSVRPLSLQEIACIQHSNSLICS